MITYRVKDNWNYNQKSSDAKSHASTEANEYKSMGTLWFWISDSGQEHDYQREATQWTINYDYDPTSESVHALTD